KIYTGTSVRFFAIVNAIKLVPYFALGQFDATNLTTSLTLAPIAPIATLTGAYFVRRMKPEVFYPFMYVMVFLTSLKLIWDGLHHLMA
ncbi:MAG: sulfite exporter TauE/SafE family protein, partial [Hoeflea sp.]